MTEQEFKNKKREEHEQQVKSRAEKEDAIRKFTEREVPESVEVIHRGMIAELAVMFFVDDYAVLDHLRQCNEHLDEAIKATPHD
jgi:hypothetical protein